MAVKPGRITATGQLVPADDPARISRGRSDQIQWSAEDGGGPWQVVFRSGTPFGTTTTFDVPQNGVKMSGVPTAIGKYKYDIVNPATGQTTQDPDVEVDI